MAQGNYMQHNRKRRRGRKILGTVAFLLTVFSVAAIICLAMFFHISEIYVTGLTGVDPQEIIQVSGLAPEQNIFSFDSGQVAQVIYDRYPQMDRVRVHRRLPTTIEIAVVETTPTLAVVGTADSYSLLGGNGRILMHKEGISTEGLPLVLGIDMRNLPAGTAVTQKELDTQTRLTATMVRQVRNKELDEATLTAQQDYNERLYSAVNKMTAALHMLEAAQGAQLESISYYDVTDELAVSMLYDDRVLLEFGTELDLQYKMEFALRVLEELEDNFSGTVDLSTAGNNSRVYSREQNIEPLLSSIYREGYY